LVSQQFLGLVMPVQLRSDDPPPLIVSRVVPHVATIHVVVPSIRNVAVLVVGDLNVV
jgi:hypothetical protein